VIISSYGTTDETTKKDQFHYIRMTPEYKGKLADIIAFLIQQ
jgi:hypothetical protein